METRICKYQIAASLRNSRPSKTPLHHLIMLSFIMIRIFCFYRVCILNWPPPSMRPGRKQVRGIFLSLIKLKIFSKIFSYLEIFKKGSRLSTVLNDMNMQHKVVVKAELFVVFKLFQVDLVEYQCNISAHMCTKARLG